MTPEDLAKAYAETIYGPVNGWGQHVHPTLGVSHGIMLRLRREVGEDECCRLIEVAMSEYRAKREALEQAPMPWCDHCQCYHHHTAHCINKSVGPDLVCWEHQANREPIRLSFSIKVF